MGQKSFIHPTNLDLRFFTRNFLQTHFFISFFFPSLIINTIRFFLELKNYYYSYQIKIISKEYTLNIKLTYLWSCLWCRRPDNFLSSSSSAVASLTLITWPSSSQIFSNCTLGLSIDVLSLKQEAALSEIGASLSLLTTFSAMSSSASVISSSLINFMNNFMINFFQRIIKKIF